VIKTILTTGERRVDRTKVGTMSIFGKQLRFCLMDGKLPLMTHRKTFPRGIIEEILWIIRGQTDSKILSEKKVNIWNDNSSKEFLEKRGLGHYKPGDIGPAYGFQLRHNGADYKGCDKDYTGKGFDQLEYVIKLLKEDPSSRRIMFTLWNPSQLAEMALPPCAFNYQFYVSNGFLSCILTQRSSDIALAGWANVLTGSLLTYMLAKVTAGLKPKEFIWNIGDIHIYMNQLESAEQMVIREPRQFPTLKLKMPQGGNIEKFQVSDFEICGYNPHGPIKVAMNA